MYNNKTFKIIGIHNEHPATLYIQFSMGERYYIYELSKFRKSEEIREQCFDNSYSELSIDLQDKEYLIGKLKFFPKTKRVINEYRYKAN